MGRQWTGVRTVEKSRKLDLRWLLRSDYIIKGSINAGILSWVDGSTAIFIAKFTMEEKYFRIKYTLTNISTGLECQYDYNIQIATIPSNLGVGEIPYFICPLTGRRAKVLIMAYGHDKYVHREAYGSLLESKPLYYSVQQASAYDYHNNRYFNLKKRYDELEDRLFNKPWVKQVYNGKPTRDMSNLLKLKDKMSFHDFERTRIFRRSYEKLLGLNTIGV